jgi:Aminoglycoside-2''-adenylyltransferase
MTEQRPRVPEFEAFDADLVEWDAWHPEEVARRLAGIEAPWYVAAGWALELFLGEQRREHEDLEIAVPSERFAEVVAALDGLEFHTVSPDPAKQQRRDGRGSTLATPIALAGPLLESSHQTWAFDRPAGAWRLDVFREPSEGDTWISRRHERIRMSYERLIERTADGIPYARPEVVLLFKAKHARPKDEADFAAVAPLLEPERRRWLADALELVHPRHRWLAAL